MKVNTNIIKTYLQNKAIKVIDCTVLYKVDLNRTFLNILLDELKEKFPHNEMYINDSIPDEAFLVIRKYNG